MSVKGVYVINLDTRPDRFARVSRTLHMSDLNHVPVTRVSAVDARKPNFDVKKYITPRALAELEDLALTGKRKFHAQLTRASVGCALSHINVWKEIAEKKDVAPDDLFLILEDDATVPRKASRLIDTARHYIDTYGTAAQPFVLLMNISCHEGCRTVAPKFIINPRTFWSLQAYIVNQASVKELLKQPLVPMENQIDSELAYISHRGAVNIYAYNVFPNRSQDTDTQTQGTVFGAPYHRKVYHVELASIMKTEFEKLHPSNKLSDGAIAGIVIGCVGVIAIAVAVAVVVYQKSRRQRM